eukprot:TRINITY_DN10782_c1_g1_i1.p1 TRINITY_DN10782_c1_g1~~TRINITY_DN10782_c1_g1_i1.p1  ORF type:complete len:500 (-),score=89.58 TRINITY_DN10782_c1_g1_i1:36-1481(-)
MSSGTLPLPLVAGVAVAAAGLGALGTYALLTSNKEKGSSSSSSSSSSSTAPRSMTSKSDWQKFDKDYAETELRIIREEEERKQQALLSGSKDEVFLEQMNRTILFYGEDAFDRIRHARVVVVGLGGVGSAAAHVLLRSGVGWMRLVDPDVVTLSSLNRNSLAMRKDVGRAKVTVLKDYFAAISPETTVEAMQMFFTEDLAPTLLQCNPSFVLDCIDNRDTKVALMHYCKVNNIPIISAFGAGSTCDPTKISITDIADTFGCPLGRDVRKHLRLRNVTNGILCVSSIEKDRKKMIPLTDDEIAEVKLQKEQGVKRLLRVGTLGVSMPIPNIFGTAMANAVLNSLSGLPVIFKGEIYVPPSSNESMRWHKILTKTEHHLSKTPPGEVARALSADDLKYVAEHVWGGKSSVSPASEQGRGGMNIARWRRELPLGINNLVILNDVEYAYHKKPATAALPVEKAYPPEIVSRIDHVLRLDTNPDHH